jgi:hypothetical protein
VREAFQRFNFFADSVLVKFEHGRGSLTECVDS